MEVVCVKLEQLVGERFKERPSDCAIDSHALMIRGGYMKYVASGIFSSYTVLRRITRKIEGIIREEMDAVGGQEVLLPVAMPASLWEESGRYGSIGGELLRFTDRGGGAMVLGMTHEEAAVHLVRDCAQSHTKYPFMIYQIQTKFRDEARPRGGLMRVREFTMKDGYSFHTSQADLERCFERCSRAYRRIFARVGIPEVVPVASDSGVMGGSVSHEFMLLTPVGEDSIAVCGACDYRANVEAAACVTANERAGEEPLAMVHTPGAKTIEDVCDCLNLPVERCCKAVVYQKNANDEYVVLFIRGDLEVSETKLRGFLGGEIRPAVISDDSGVCAGFIGPYQLRGDFTVLFDRSLEGAANLCCGANKADYHYTGLHLGRDVGAAAYQDFAKIKDGGICPKCGKSSIAVSRGVELGHIFQLGTKYTAAMHMRYTDEKGEEQFPLMGCYGIGVGRLAACVCEARHDGHGPLWPMAIAPWQAHLCCLRADDAGARTAADDLYERLQGHGVEVVYDDRPVSAGVMFSDADLLGVPVRVIVSPRGIKDGCCEIVTRDKSVSLRAPVARAASEIERLINDLSHVQTPK